MDIQVVDFPSVPLLRRKQLKAIHGLAGFSRKMHKPFWLAGGWAVEALNGEASPRLHGDVDLLIFRADYSSFHSYLARCKFFFLGEQYHGFSAAQNTGSGPMLFSFVFLDWDEGKLVTYLPDDTVNWPCEDPCSLPFELLGGKPVPCCSWELSFAFSELGKFLDPEHRDSLDKGQYAEQIKPARRKAIINSLITPYKPD